MCPVCIATMTMVVAGSASTGGLTALVAKKFRRKVDAKLITNNPEETRTHHDNHFNLNQTKT
jgi:hypothetical protein